MRHEYTDGRGLKVDPNQVHEMFGKIDIDEEDIIQLLGERRSFSDGYMLSFLEMVHTHDEFYFGPKDKPLTMTCL